MTLGKDLRKHTYILIDENTFKISNHIFLFDFFTEISIKCRRGKWLTDWNNDQATWVLLQAFLMKCCVTLSKVSLFSYCYNFSVLRAFHGKINFKSPVNTNLQHCWNGTVTFTPFLKHQNIYQRKIVFWGQQLLQSKFIKKLIICWDI